MTERNLARIASTAFDAPENVTAGELAAAIETLKAPALPLKREEPALDGQKARVVEDALRPIGAALNPAMAPEPAKAWRKALLMKLSDIPGDILIFAARKAVHEPFEFFSQVEKVIREHAKAAIKSRDSALWRLERWLDELERSKVPAIEAPPPEPVTQAEVDQMNAYMRGAGLSTRWRLEDGDAVMEVGPSDERRAEP